MGVGAGEKDERRTSNFEHRTTISLRGNYFSEDS